MSGTSTTSSLGADVRDSGEVNVKAGHQRVLQVFITNSANVFMLEASEHEHLLEEQASIFVTKLLLQVIQSHIDVGCVSSWLESGCCFPYC